MTATAWNHGSPVTVVDPLGLHLRFASRLVMVASRFDGCEIRIAKDNRTANAKSVLELLMLAAETGSELIVEACGQEAREAVGAIVGAAQAEFGCCPTPPQESRLNLL